MSGEVGKPAPDVTLVGPKGSLRLADLLGRRALVLYFYPRDGTPICTAEACGFRDHHDEFAAAGAEVVGVSQDSLDSHTKFRDEHRLPFTLLSDPDGTAARAFGVKKALGLWPGRVTFVIDKQGVIRHRFESALRARKHVAEALDLVRSLAG
jgi:thioredoxin-dependent peroxiredoxin